MNNNMPYPYYLPPPNSAGGEGPVILVSIVSIIGLLLGAAAAFWWFKIRKINGKWSEWTKDGVCTKDCKLDSTAQKWVRKCDNPKPENDGKECTKDEKENMGEKTEQCNDFIECKQHTITKIPAVGTATLEGGVYTDYDNSCPEGAFITAFTGKEKGYSTVDGTEKYIDSIGFTCSDQTTKPPTGNSNSTGIDYNIKNDPGFSSIDVYTDSVVDGIKYSIFSAGATEGTFDTLKCTDGLISGIHGKASNTQVVGSLGIHCRPN
jgi:hypothetical protein